MTKGDDKSAVTFIETYRTKCVDENPLKPLEILGLRGFNLFLNNFEGGQNVLIKQF